MQKYLLYLAGVCCLCSENLPMGLFYTLARLHDNLQGCQSLGPWDFETRFRIEFSQSELRESCGCRRLRTLSDEAK